VNLFAEYEEGRMGRDLLITKGEEIAALYRGEGCHFQLSLATNLDVFEVQSAEFVSQSGKAS
jgi:hypothetical protein